MTGKIIMLCSFLFGLLGMGIWYLSLTLFLKKHKMQNAEKVQSKVKKFMYFSSAITVISLAGVVIGVIMSIKGI